MRRSEFERVVFAVMDDLPGWVHESLDNLSVVIADEPTSDQADGNPGLLGLYEGVSLLDRGNDYSSVMPDTITVFRNAHLALGLDVDSLRAEIRVTVLHEIAHHLGMDEARLHELGWD